MVAYIFLALTTMAAATLALLYVRDRKSMREMRREALSFRTLAHNAPAGIWRTDRDGQCVFVNKAWQQMAGLHAGEWQGDGWADALHVSDRERVRSKFAAAVANAAVFEEEIRWQRPNGDVIWVRVHGAPEFDDKDQVVGYVGLNIPIQETKRLEARLSAALIKTRRADASTDPSRVEPNEEMLLPVTGVLGSTQQLRRSASAEKKRSPVQLQPHFSDEMMPRSDEVLDPPTTKRETPPELLQATSVGQTLRYAADMFEPLARSKNLTLGVWIDDAVPETIAADALRLRQIILNLVCNAVRFTDEGGIDIEARVEQSSSGRCLLICVIDTGIGIEPSRLEAMFDVSNMENGDDARREKTQDLGLTVSSQLVSKMGGTICAFSKPGIGTNFTVRLPLKEGADQAPGVRDEAEMTDRALTYLEGARLMIAEPRALDQQLIMTLALSFGMETHLVETAEHAVRAVIDADKAGEPFDAVLMNVDIADDGGCETTRRLRALGFSAEELPVIAISAETSPDAISRYTDAGMQSHLANPVTAAALAETLTQCLRYSACREDRLGFAR